MKDISKLNEIFNIEKADPTPLVPIENNKDFDREDDYTLARQTMRKLLIKGEDTLDELINLAKNSEHPRTYEVTGQLMKTLSDVSKDLMGLQKQIKELENDGNPSQQIGTQNNVVFAGSTHELMKLLGKKDGDNTIDQ
jgi:gas vesicle protein